MNARKKEPSSSQYNQLELSALVGDGDEHSPENGQRKVDAARAQAIFYEKQRSQWERQHHELETINKQKSFFAEELEALGMKLHNATRRVDQELISIEHENLQLTQVSACLKRHLQILTALDAKNWSPEGFEERMKEALPKLLRAENDFQEAFSAGQGLRHTKILRNKPGVANRPILALRTMIDEMLRGFFFHLPLLLVFALAYAFYFYFNS